MNFGRKKGRGGRRRANQKFFFLWYRVEFLILITHSPTRWQEIGADVPQFQPKGRFCLCLQECEKFIQALASKYITFYSRSVFGKRYSRSFNLIQEVFGTWENMLRNRRCHAKLQIQLNSQNNYFHSPLLLPIVGTKYFTWKTMINF